MDTTEAAARLGTTPRILRQFLRSPISTFVAVGSGARYEFTETDLVTLERRFSDWRTGNKTAPKKKSPKNTTPLPKTPPVTRPKTKPSKKDERVWEEEGRVVIDDIRQPRVRARVLSDARAAEDRLMMLLMSRGLHVSQLGDQRKASA